MIRFKKESSLGLRTNDPDLAKRFAQEANDENYAEFQRDENPYGVMGVIKEIYRSDNGKWELTLIYTSSIDSYGLGRATTIKWLLYDLENFQIIAKGYEDTSNLLAKHWKEQLSEKIGEFELSQ